MEINQYRRPFQLFRKISIGFFIMMLAMPGTISLPKVYGQESDLFSLQKAIQPNTDAKDILASLPTPAGAQKATQESQYYPGMDVFVTSLSPSEVQAFYERRLSAQGWQIAGQPLALSEITKQQQPFFSDSKQVQNAVSDYFSNVRVFKRDEAIVTLSILETTPKGETRYSLSTVTRSSFLQPTLPDQDTIVEQPLTQHLNLPVPEAAQILNQAQTAQVQVVTYSSNQPQQAIAMFYRNTMPSYGWSLQSQQEISPNAVPSAVKENCPGCSNPVKELQALGVTMSVIEQLYTDLQGQTCSVMISAAIGNVPETFRGKTTIVIQKSSPR